MEKFQEIINDPAKLEAFLKDSWAKIDAKGEGAVTYEQYIAGADAISKSLGFPEEKPPTEEEIAAAKKVADTMQKQADLEAAMNAMIEETKKGAK